ncbi:hypothetical protein PMAYCL1PPCAC_13889, partial [Pristionchus mayeri]
ILTMRVSIILCYVVSQLFTATALSTTTDKCSVRKSVVCVGQEYRMTLEDCQAGYEYMYCAKAGVRNIITRNWSVKNATFSTYQKLNRNSCVKLGANELRVVLLIPMDIEIDVQDMQRICNQSKPKFSITPEDEVDSSSVIMERFSDQNLQKEIADLYSMTSHNRLFILGLFALVLVLAIFAYTYFKKTLNRLHFYSSGHQLITECDSASAC